jgi:hypothetical protein
MFLHTRRTLSYAYDSASRSSTVPQRQESLRPPPLLCAGTLRAVGRPPVLRVAPGARERVWTHFCSLLQAPARCRQGALSLPQEVVPAPGPRRGLESLATLAAPAGGAAASYGTRSASAGRVVCPRRPLCAGPGPWSSGASLACGARACPPPGAARRTFPGRGRQAAHARPPRAAHPPERGPATTRAGERRPKAGNNASPPRVSLWPGNHWAFSALACEGLLLLVWQAIAHPAALPGEEPRSPPIYTRILRHDPMANCDWSHNVATSAAVAVQSEIAGREDEVKACMVLRAGKQGTPKAFSIIARAHAVFCYATLCRVGQDAPQNPYRENPEAQTRGAGVTTKPGPRGSGYKVRRRYPVVPVPGRSHCPWGNGICLSLQRLNVLTHVEIRSRARRRLSSELA